MADINRGALNLLFSCNRKGDWEPKLYDKSVISLLKVMSDHPDFRDIFESEIAYDLLLIHLKDFSLNHSTNTFSTADAELLVSKIRGNLALNLKEHWIVIPLRNAKLSRTLRFRDFVFISGSRDEKLNTLCNLSQITLSEIKQRATHTEKTRSPGFFDHPLLAIRVSHQTGRVERQSEVVSLWATCCLQAIYWGYIYPEHKSPLAFLRAAPLRECEHLVIYAKKSKWWVHNPLHYRARCAFSLDWLEKRSHQDRFYKLFDSIVTPFSMVPFSMVISSSYDDLAYRFFRALRYFSKAIDAEENTEKFEGMGLTLLFLIIAAESVLLDQGSAKSLKLTVLLPRFAKLPSFSINEHALAVDFAYRRRSDFVHTGGETFKNWNEDFSAGDTAQKVLLVKRMVAKLLSDAPKHLERMNSLANSSSSNVNKCWFELLRTEWEKSFGIRREEYSS